MNSIRYSLRALRKTPAFTLGAVVTVALTVGATTAIFSVVYGVLLRQLPYRDVEQVFWIWSDQPGRDRTPFNVPDFIDYRDSTRTLSGFAGFFAYSANLSDEAAAERVQGIARHRQSVRRHGRASADRPLAAARRRAARGGARRRADRTVLDAAIWRRPGHRRPRDPAQ